MSNWKVHRRHLLTGAGAIFTLPLLEAMLSKRAWATGGGDPRRFVSLYMPNGTYNVQGDARWYPQPMVTAPLQANSLPIVLSPFAANIGDFSVIMHQGCNARDTCLNTRGGGGHSSAVTTWLSQAIMGDVNSSSCTVPGSSFDQLYANTTPNQKNVLCISGGCNDSSPDGLPFNYADYVSFNNGQPNSVIKNPYELFINTFANLGSTTPPPAASTDPATRNRSILDTATADIKDMQSKLGKTDNQKLDQYFTSVRDLETRLYAAPTTTGSGCAPGTPPDMSTNTDDQDGADSAAYTARIQAFFDMIVLAFQCDVFRSVSFMYDGDCGQRVNNQCPANLLYGGADLSGVLHTGISHWGQNDNGPNLCTSRDRFYVLLFTYLLNGLKGAQDPSGKTLLDNSALLAGYCVYDGNHTNTWEGQPLLLGGGSNIGLHPGNCFDTRDSSGPPMRFSNNNNYGPGNLPPSYDMTDVYYTIGNALGMDPSVFQGTPFEGAGVINL